MEHLTFDAAYWRRVDELLKGALALPPGARAVWLESLSAEDGNFRERLTTLLARADQPHEPFLNNPVDWTAVEAAADALHGDSPGVMVGPYRLIQLLGTGGMGTVWLADAIGGEVRRQVALKLPKAGWSSAQFERLRRERDFLSALEHPGIARLYDAGITANGRPYLAMEAIRGLSIDEYCLARALDTNARLGLFLKVAAAVSFAHAHLVVHRDLKPSNILVDDAGNPHVVDFGLAKLLDVTDPQQDQTLLEHRALTPDYASPEQITGGRISVASDVYSLGVVLYQLLTGSRPYRLRRGSAAALEEAILSADVPRASSRIEQDKRLARRLRGDMDNILAKALSLAPADRYSTVDAFAEDIERHLKGEPVHAQRQTIQYRARKFALRHRWGLSVLALFLVTLAGGVAAILQQATVAREQARLANAGRVAALRELRFSTSAEELLRLLLTEQSSKPVLDRLSMANRLVAAQFSDDPSLRARLEVLLADLYAEAGAYAEMGRTLELAHASAVAAGDASTITEVNCQLGALYGETGRREQGLKLLNDSIVSLAADASASKRVFAACLLQRGLFYRVMGRMDVALNDIRKAMEIAKADENHPRLHINTLQLRLADVLSRTGQIAEGREIYRQVLSEYRRLGRETTTKGMQALGSYLALLHRAGQFDEALQTLQGSGLMDSGNKAIGDTLSVHLARVLIGVGRYDEAGQLAREMAEKKRLAGDMRSAFLANLLELRSVCESGESERCGKNVDRVKKLAANFYKDGHIVLAQVMLQESWAMKLPTERDRAIKRLRESLVVFDASPERDPMAIAARVRLVELLLAAGANLDAEREARAAVASARSLAQGLEHSSWLGEALLAHAEQLAATGSTAEAAANADEARKHLIAGLGKESPRFAYLERRLRKLTER